MITTAPGEYVLDLRGLSTDIKPTRTNDEPYGKVLGNGSTFIEIDTSKVFMYDEDGDAWNEFKVPTK